MSLSRTETVFGSTFHQMAGAVQRDARFAIVVLVNGRHSAGVADLRRRLLDVLSVLEQAMEVGRH